MPLLLQPFSGKYSTLVEDPNVNIGSKYKWIETTGFCTGYEMCLQWEGPVSNTATPAHLSAEWPMSAPCLKKETNKNLKT